MSKAVDEELIIVLAELRQNEVGDRFFRAYSAYAAELTKDLIKSPPDRVHLNLGIARQADVLVEMFKDAPESARKIIEAREAAKLRSKS